MSTLKNECCKEPGVIKFNGIKKGNISSYVSDGLKRIKFAFKQLAYFPYDVIAVFKNDPALKGKIFGFLEIILYAGVWAMFFHRIAHLFYTLKIPFFPRLISQFSRLITGIEIHPGAVIGKGIFIDHGNGVVIGETAIVGENVLMYHQVTLGARGGNEAGKRHPTIGDNVVLGAGSKIIGDIIVGNGSIVGAQSLVLKNVDNDTIVAGNPAGVIRQTN